ncbi:MAG TPA: hypothetical protein VH186_34735 [Chloroflexia bacterium]|nr:hypothetical protein [Chloroflexia bacterium]
MQLTSLLFALVLSMVFARLIWRPNDFYGWGLCVVPPCLAGTLLLRFWSNSSFLKQIFIAGWLITIGTLTTGQFVSQMETLGYTISYWHAQLRYDPYAVDHVLENFNAEVDFVLFYLIIATLLLTLPFVFLPVLARLKRAYVGRVRKPVNL